jgi:hypothetical protein
MPVATVNELSTKYPRWNFAIISTLGNDRIALGPTPNGEDWYVCKAVNNPTTQAIYTTPQVRSPIEAVNLMDEILSTVNQNTKFASVIGQLRITSDIRVFGYVIAYEIGGGGGIGGPIVEGPPEEQPGPG